MNRPTLSVNFAISADGRISGPERQPSGWTSIADHQRLLDLRASAGALLVGRGTLLADQMTLTAPDATHPPLRCIVSRSGKLDSSLPLFQRHGGDIHLLVTGPGPDAVQAPMGVTVHNDNLKGFLQTLLHDHGVRHVHCEGGGELVRALAAADLVDTLHLTWAGHSLFGGHASPGITGIPGDFLPASRNFQLVDFDPRPELAECFLTWKRV